jgi:DNA-binding NarL/FixJ family response regulator
VIITDIQMPGMDGIEATKALKLLKEPAGIIAFSNYDEDSYIVDMLEAGASGYLLKNTKKKEIFEAIRLVAAKGKYYCNSTSVKLARMIANSKAELGTIKEAIKFTPREMEVISHICNELSNKEIADAMYLSVRTVEGYRDRILEKTGARNAVGLVIYAIRTGLFQVDKK